MKLASRWPEMAGSCTVWPALNLSVAPQTMETMLIGSMWVRSSFQASRYSSEAIAGVGGATLVNVPMRAMPVLPVLKPSVWAPTGPLVMPP